MKPGGGAGGLDGCDADGRVATAVVSRWTLFPRARASSAESSAYAADRPVTTQISAARRIDFMGSLIERAMRSVPDQPPEDSTTAGKVRLNAYPPPWAICE